MMNEFIIPDNEENKEVANQLEKFMKYIMDDAIELAIREGYTLQGALDKLHDDMENNYLN